MGWWRRVELELSREEKNTRIVETREVNTLKDRKLKEESKLNFVRKFYPDCSTSPGGKSLKLIHTNKKSELFTSKRSKISNKVDYFENGGLGDLTKPVWGLSDCT